MSIRNIAEDPFDLDRIEAITASMDLRKPNKEALESIIFEIARHYEIDHEPPPFEAVADVATGVGKTYVLGAAIEYLAGDGVRNFAVIVPGRTILNKTVANFTPGHRKSLLAGMDVRPVVITSENFATPAMRAEMEDTSAVKLFIFTVQALLKPESKVGRKTHKYQEGLGAAFYAHLQSQRDLVVFADEHHTYYGPAFSGAIRDLRPRVLIGLTATPHKKTPPDQIIYRYPLAAAIADQLVKTPVLVGRTDDRSDPQTKLLDGIRLLELKEQAIAAWAAESGATPIDPIMLVVAPSIDEADEIEGILKDASVAGGRYGNKVLTVHSDSPDEALEALEGLEEPGNRYRIVISVGMLKEGWDVKNVYVIASLRASVSDILTEQTLGRGLRLPFGRYTGVQFLDTLEVLGHERYEELLRKAGVLNEQFIDRRTRAVLQLNARGRLVPVTETTTVAAPIVSIGGATEIEVDGFSLSAESPAEATAGRPLLRSMEDQTAQGEQAIARLDLQLAPRRDVPLLRIPQLRMTQVKNEFSLSDITEFDAFRKLGESIAADPSGALRRVTLSARIFEGADGLRRTELVTARALDRVESPATLFPLNQLRTRLIDQLCAAPAVPARANQRHPAGRIVDAFIAGLSTHAENILSGYMDRAAAGLIQVVTEEQRRFATLPTYDTVVEMALLGKVRTGRAETSQDRYGPFRKGVGYEGYSKSLYSQDWFDSSTERDVATSLEDADEIAVWVRLQIGDLPILWTGAREYNPDFVAVDRDGSHWLIEVKMDKEMSSTDVQGKRQAARRWANYVSADEKVATPWSYVLVSETDVKTARGLWEALKALGV